MLTAKALKKTFVIVAALALYLPLQAEVKVLLIATKSDRLSNNQLQNALKGLAEAYPSAPVIPFSAKTGAGRDQVWNKIRESATNFSALASQS